MFSVSEWSVIGSLTGNVNLASLQKCCLIYVLPAVSVFLSEIASHIRTKTKCYVSAHLVSNDSTEFKWTVFSSLPLFHCTSSTTFQRLVQGLQPNTTKIRHPWYTDAILMCITRKSTLLFSIPVSEQYTTEMFSGNLHSRRRASSAWLQQHNLVSGERQFHHAFINGKIL